ncbi:MAG: hypothetical protein AAB721_02825 [Patescibacteria group bacterium]
MGRAAIAAVLIAALPGFAGESPDAGRWDDPLYAECPKGPPPVQLADGSWNLPPARAARNVCLLETCDSRRRTLEPIAAGPPMLSSGSLVVDLIIWGLGVAAGIYLGWSLRTALPR